MSYLISLETNRLLAETIDDLKSGSIVRVGRDTTTDTMYADEPQVLVNATYAKVSNAKKWEKRSWRVPFAQSMYFDDSYLINSPEDLF